MEVGEVRYERCSVVVTLPAEHARIQVHLKTTTSKTIVCGQDHVSLDITPIKSHRRHRFDAECGQINLNEWTSAYHVQLRVRKKLFDRDTSLQFSLRPYNESSLRFEVRFTPDARGRM